MGDHVAVQRGLVFEVVIVNDFRVGKPAERMRVAAPEASRAATSRERIVTSDRLAIKAAQAGHRVAFATAVDWVARLKAAHNAGRLPAELIKLRRIGLLVVDEVGYIPFEQDAANLFFQLVSSRYEHASLILTSNLPFARWGDVFGDQVVAAAMIDRIVQHAEVLTLKGSSYRLKDTGIDTLPSARADNTAQ
jgi:IstB-like ATP binding protein